MKDKTNEAMTNYRMQREACVHFPRKTNKNYCNDLDLSNVANNIKF